MIASAEKDTVFTHKRLSLLAEYLAYVDRQETFPPLPPTLRHLSSTVDGMSSTSVVSHHLRKLVDDGVMIHVQPNKLTAYGKYLINASRISEVRARVASLASRNIHAPITMQVDTRR